MALEFGGGWITTGAWEATWAEAAEVATKSNRTCALELAIRNFTSITPFLNHPITKFHSICEIIRGKAVGQFAVAALYERRNLVNRKPAVGSGSI
jgi:hypothetical protein